MSIATISARAAEVPTYDELDRARPCPGSRILPSGRRNANRTAACRTKPSSGFAKPACTRRCCRRPTADTKWASRPCSRPASRSARSAHRRPGCAVSTWCTTGSADCFRNRRRTRCGAKTRAPSSRAPTRRSARRHSVDGGYRLSGRFPFCSGSPGAAWNLCGARLPIGPEGQPVPAFTLVPKADYKIDWQSWRPVGLAGTGSFDLIVDDAFVPAHRVLRFSDAVGSTAPGAEHQHTTRSIACRC